MKIDHVSNTIALWLLTALCFALVIIAGLWLGWQSRRAFINCSSFSSYDEATQYTQKHPEYLARLDKNHNGAPCEDLYGY